MVGAAQVTRGRHDPDAAGGTRLLGQRRGRELQRGAAPAAVFGQGVGAQIQNPHSRRGDELHRSRHRQVDPGDDSRRVRPWQVHSADHRPPPGLDHRLGPHLGDVGRSRR